jgi:hypothetical protein
MKPDRDFIKISFPSEIESHIGWKNEKAMLARKDILEQEADSIVQTVDAQLRAGQDKNIWLIYGDDVEVNEILKHRLDAQYSLTQKKDLEWKGPFYYNEILTYR